MSMHPFFSHLLNRRNALLFALVVVAAFVVWYSGELRVVNDQVATFFRVVSGYDQRWAGGVFIFFAALSAVFTFFTSTPLVPIAIVLWGHTITFILLLGGWMLGAMIAYAIGTMATRFLRRFKFFSTVQTYREKLAGGNEFLLMLLFALAVPAEIVSYTLGIVRYSFWRFICVQLVANAPFALLALYSTSSLFNRQPLLFIGYMILGGVVMSGCVYFFYRALQRKDRAPNR